MVVPSRTMTGVGPPTTPQTLRSKLERLEELPVLPAVVVRLMQLDDEAPHYFDEVLQLVQSEPSFSARILALANSAASAPRQPIVSTKDALQRLGTRQAVSMLLATAVARVFVPRDRWEKCLWRHSLEVAVLARELAGRSHKVDPEHAYTCGLLHDLGRFILFHQEPEELGRVENAPWTTASELLAAERSVFGITHSELGALACRTWRLPEAIGHVVSTHHSVLGGVNNDLGRIVQVADAMMFESVRPDGDRKVEVREPALALVQALGVSSLEALHEIVDASRRDAQVMARALGVQGC